MLLSLLLLLLLRLLLSLRLPLLLLLPLLQLDVSGCQGPRRAAVPLLPSCLLVCLPLNRMHRPRLLLNRKKAAVAFHLYRHLGLL